MTFRIKQRIHRPCIRCGRLFEKKSKRQMVCPVCRRAAWKHGGKTRQQQYKLLGGRGPRWGEIRKAPSFGIPKIGPLLPINISN